ncbi:MAG TPA: hypothetical protein VGY30_09055 [Solirubrobacteraceae bacterium]|jgi:hypothetical protein|nr:hypothetical protein [Solirubrobacteraceae bacterium]
MIADRHRIGSLIVKKETSVMTMLARVSLLAGPRCVAGTLATVVLFGMGLGATTSALASTGPAWKAASMSDTTAQPGGTLDYEAWFRNTGDASMDGSPITVTVTLPPGLRLAEPQKATMKYQACTAMNGSPVVGGEQQFKCETSERIRDAAESGGFDGMVLSFVTAVDPAAVPGNTITSRFTVEGGGAAPASTIDPVLISASEPSFGVAAFDGLVEGAGGSAFTQAGGHPESLTTTLDFNTHSLPSQPLRGDFYPVEPVRDVVVGLPVGLVGNPTIADRCTLQQLSGEGHVTESKPLCPSTSQVGTAFIRFRSEGGFVEPLGPVPLFNMEPAPGEPARFGFNILGNAIILDTVLRSNYTIAVVSPKINQYLPVNGTTVTFWGVPSAASHTPERACSGQEPPAYGGPTCASGRPELPFLRMPTVCTNEGEGMKWGVAIDSWDHPGTVRPGGEPETEDHNWKTASYTSHEPPGYPTSPNDPSTPWGETVGVHGCEDVPVKGRLSAVPTALETETPSGLVVHVEIPNPGFDNPTGLASSDIKGVKVTLPVGMTINPSQAEGLGVCTPAQYASTELSFHPTTKGCPPDSKMGTIVLHTPLLEEAIEGNVYIAQPYVNPFGSLLALYIVFENPQRGMLIKQPGKVETDPVTGQITTTFDNIPQLPFSSFDFKFREGARAPLVTPPLCGTYTTQAVFTPWSDPAKTLLSVSQFETVDGIGGGPCPSGGTSSFAPQVVSGTQNNNAASYTPFDLHILRQDGEQEITKFTTILPTGLTGNLVGIPFCPDAAIEAARHRTGQQELAQPSCPAASEIGHTIVGAGVGSVLSHTPGKIYLAGPYHGSNLSIVSVTSATVGPFDLGTVVIRFGLRINPITAQVEVDSTGSDPIPHIIKGIVVHVRDIRVYMDRPNFIRNPTSCDPSSITNTITGAGADYTNPADQNPVSVNTRFQAANCSLLAFKPSFKVTTSGKTSRARGASLTAKLIYPKAPEGSQANIRSVKVDLPKQLPSRLTTLQKACTDRTFNQNPAACPAASRVGIAKAITPILPEPLTGPAYFVSHGGAKFPELIIVIQGYGFTIDLHGETFINEKTNITSSTFRTVPDQPVTSFELTLPQGPNSALAAIGNLCNSKLKMPTTFTAQNGAVIHQTTPVTATGCARHKAKKARNASRRHHHHQHNTEKANKK